MKKMISLLLVVVLVLSIAPEFPELFELGMTAEAAATGITGDGYEYEVTDEGEVTITGYSGAETNLVIPESIEGYPVKVIGEKAFYGLDSLESIVLPEELTAIGDSAFAKCTNLVSITLFEKVSVIGMYVFQDCTSLKNISIPKDVTVIDKFTFAGCTSLNDVIIPEGVTIINYAAFYNCTSLTDIELPKSLIDIGGSAFSYCTSLKSISIPQGILDIGGSTFSNCTSLTSVDIPEGLTVIHHNAFGSCTSLKNIKLPESLITISSSAFSSSGLTNITIPSKVTTIEGSVFCECKDLTKVVILGEIDKINLWMFYGCTNLEEITIPESVTAIDKYAFELCNNLTDIFYSSNRTQWNSISVDESNNELSYAAVHFTDSIKINDFEYEIISGQRAIVTKYCGNAYDVSIPTFAEGYLITEIGPSAFRDCDSLRSVTIPESVFNIDNYAFYNCDNLTDIYYLGTREQLYKTGYNSFMSKVNIYYLGIENNNGWEYTSYSENYAVVTGYNGYDGDIVDCIVPSVPAFIDGCSVREIGRYTFLYDYYFYNIAIPEGITIIDDYTFEYCEYLTEVYYLGTEEQWQQISIGAGNDYLLNANLHFLGSEKNNGLIYEVISDEYVIITGYNGDMTDLIIPAFIDGYPVRGISDYSFYDCSDLKSVVIPEGITCIGNYAFYGCASLKSIIMPYAVVNVGDYAFNNCNSLVDVYYFGNKDEWNEINIGKQNYCLLNADIHFIDKEGIEGLLYEINSEGYAAITGYWGEETDLIIPEYIGYYPVCAINDSAFSDCTNLTSIEIPLGVKEIGDSAFSGCSSLVSITMPKSVTSIGDRAFYSCSSLLNITIPEGVTSIGKCAFIYCDNLKSVTIPGSVTSIGDSAFKDCDSLTNVIIPEGVTSIGDNAFCNCDGLTSIIIPKSVVSIGDGAFNFCEKIVSITIPEGVTSIGEYAFSNCDSLTSIIIPGSAVSTGDYAFCYCDNLSSVTISEGVTSIGKFAFHGCDKLTSVEVPLSVTTIDTAAFYFCTNITDIYYSGTEKQWSEVSINEQNDYMLKADIHYLGLTEITSVDITDIDVPVAGYLLDITATCVTTGIENSDIIVEWFDAESNEVSETAAKLNTVYAVKVTLIPDDTYAFAEDITATINGNIATGAVQNLDGTLTVEYIFESTSDSIFIEAESYDSMSGVAIRGTQDQNSDVICSIDAGDYMIYTVNIPETGIYRFDVRAARSDSSTSILSLMAEDSVIATCSIAQTGGWSTFSEFEGSEAELTAGTYTFKVYANGGRYNLNWYRLVYVGEAAAEEDGIIRIEAESYDSMSGVALRDTKDQGSDVISSVDAGDYMIYTVDIQKDGIYRFDVRAARSDTGVSMLNLMENDSVIASCGITQTGGWSSFSDLEGSEVYLTSGIHIFKVYAKGGRYNLNWYELVLIDENEAITDGSVLIEAESYDSMSGVALRDTQDMGSDVISSVDAGDYMIYTVEVPASGTYRFDVRAARSDSGTSVLNLMENDSVIASCGITQTGGWSTFSNIEGSEVYLAEGTHTFKVYAKGGRYNLNWYKLTCIALDEDE